jgi:hypothetical protein
MWALRPWSRAIPVIGSKLTRAMHSRSRTWLAAVWRDCDGGAAASGTLVRFAAGPRLVAYGLRPKLRGIDLSNRQ